MRIRIAIATVAMVRLELVHNIRFTKRYNLYKYPWVPSHIGVKGNEEADKLIRLTVTQSHQSKHWYLPKERRIDRKPALKITWQVKYRRENKGTMKGLDDQPNYNLNSITSNRSPKPEYLEWGLTENNELNTTTPYANVMTDIAPHMCCWSVIKTNKKRT